MDLKDYNIAFGYALPVSNKVTNVQLFNPGENEKLLILNKARAWAASPSQFQIAIGFTTVDLDGTSANIFTNRGGSYGELAKCTFKEGDPNEHLAVSEYFEWSILDDDIAYENRILFPGQIILPPEVGITVAHRDVNRGLFVQFIWDE